MCVGHGLSLVEVSHVTLILSVYIIYDFFIVDEVYCLFLCFFFLCYVLLFLNFCVSASVVGSCTAGSACWRCLALVTLCITFSLFLSLIPFQVVNCIWFVSIIVCLWLRSLSRHCYWLFFIIDDFSSWMMLIACSYASCVFVTYWFSWSFAVLWLHFGGGFVYCKEGLLGLPGSGHIMYYLFLIPVPYPFSSS